MTASKRNALNKILTDADQRRADTGKARHKPLPKVVKCVFCRKEVLFKTTRATPIGRGCKSHHGV